jgi:ABC-type transporter Mla maintaining outer membrane lipid asymmetry ATPase subunit MlaF
MTVDAEIIKARDLEGVSSILVTHQLRDAFHVAENAAVRASNQVEFQPAPPEKVAQCEFLMLREGTVIFEGDAHAFRRAADPYIQSFLS